MPVFRFDKAFGMARGVKAFLNPRNDQRRISERRERIKSKRQELRAVKEQQLAAKEYAERIEHKKRKKRIQQELFQLERDLRAAKERAEGAPDGRTAPRGADEPETGALPDFVIIGAKKCGTSFLYNLLTRHPHVEPAAKKELHYFNTLFEEGVEWYRQFFPPPRWKNGQKTITGEATPEYLSYPPAPERMAEVVPQARLISLLRNPVDRAYSDYHHVVRKKRETRTFEEAVEEAIEAEKTTRPLVKEAGTSEHEDRADTGSVYREYLSKGIYVDQLLRWSKFFSEEQMLVLKSEDFFERTPETLKLVLNFLDLPGWEPDSLEILRKRNKGEYERGMDPATRRRLEEFFEPHNRRLYEYLGVDFGW